MSSKLYFFQKQGLRKNCADGAEDQEGKESMIERTSMMVLRQKDVGFGKV